MGPYEKFLKLLITFVGTLCLYSMGINIVQALVLSHILNFVLNAQPMVILRYKLKFVMVSWSKLNVLNLFIHKYANIFGVERVFVFGGLCRENFKPTSDLDVRVKISNDIWSGFLGAVFIMILRTWSFLRCFPLDVYMFQDSTFIDRLRSDEVPILIYSFDVKDKEQISSNLNSLRLFLNG